MKGKRAAANVAAYILSIDTYVTNTEKKSKIGKRVYFFKVSGKFSCYKLILNLLSKAIKKNCERVNLSKFRYIIFILPGILLQLTMDL